MDLFLARFWVKDTQGSLKLAGCDTNILNRNARLPHAVTLGQVLQPWIPANRPEIKELLITHDKLICKQLGRRTDTDPPLGVPWEDADDISERLIASARSLRSSPALCSTATHFQKVKSKNAELIYIQNASRFSQTRTANKAGQEFCQKYLQNNRKQS